MKMQSNIFLISNDAVLSSKDAMKFMDIYVIKLELKTKKEQKGS